MESGKAKELAEKLDAIRSLMAELKEQAGDFPSIVRNGVRVEASLNMMAVALGVSVLEKR